MAAKRILISVINDLVTDQRVDKMSRLLVGLGYDVCLVGRRKQDSLSLTPRPYQTHRLRLLFEKGPFFYAEYNLRLFFFLLSNHVDLLVSNDLDTLLPNFLIHKLKHIPLMYDSHEYFTGGPELQGRPFVLKTWKAIERWILPKLRKMITVNDSIADLYRQEYGIEVMVVRNLPEKKAEMPVAYRPGLGLPADKSLVLLQGAGINVERGAEEAVLAMQYLEGVVLLIIGDGDVLDVLKGMVKERGLDNKVIFIPKQPLDALMQYTVCADIGLTLDKDRSINYRFSLPNKLFDYIRAGVPVLASPLPEVKKVINHYQIGTFIDSHDPEHIAGRIRSILSDTERYAVWKENLNIAASELSWENECKILTDEYRRYL
jgi:glycosyltransferase involved in cell wall biosynthesis